MKKKVLFVLKGIILLGVIALIMGIGVKRLVKPFGPYTKFIRSGGYAEKFTYRDSGDILYYEIADIDNNGVSELLMCDGNYSGASIVIYTIQNRQVVCLGRYSKYGELTVLKAKDHSILLSGYGGQGAFTDVYTKMEDGVMNTIAVFFSEGKGFESDETLYYMGFPFSTDLRADNFELDYQLITDEYLVTEEEYQNAQSAIFDSDDYVVEAYSCPKELIIP